MPESPHYRSASRGQSQPAFIKLLAKQFKVSKSQVELISADTRREKRFKVSGLSCVPTVLKEKDNANNRQET